MFKLLSQAENVCPREKSVIPIFWLEFGVHTIQPEGDSEQLVGGTLEGVRAGCLRHSGYSRHSCTLQGGGTTLWCFHSPLVREGTSDPKVINTMSPGRTSLGNTVRKTVNTGMKTLKIRSYFAVKYWTKYCTQGSVHNQAICGTVIYPTSFDQREAAGHAGRWVII